jgi:hypothetical protein
MQRRWVPAQLSQDTAARDSPKRRWRRLGVLRVLGEKQLA